jgi:hypothetical protein
LFDRDARAGQPGDCRGDIVVDDEADVGASRSWAQRLWLELLASLMEIDLARPEPQRCAARAEGYRRVHVHHGQHEMVEPVDVNGALLSLTHWPVDRHACCERGGRPSDAQNNLIRAVAGLSEPGLAAAPNGGAARSPNSRLGHAA